MPKTRKLKEREISTLANQILVAKAKDAKADTSSWELEVDQLVYSLYDLTPEEIVLIEGVSQVLEENVESEIAVVVEGALGLP